MHLMIQLAGRTATTLAILLKRAIYEKRVRERRQSQIDTHLQI